VIEKDVIPFYTKQEKYLTESAAEETKDARHIRETCMLATNVMRLVRAIRNSPTYCKI